MHQESNVSTRPDALAGYGDLASFDPQQKGRTSETDEDAAIALIMGGEDFTVGDGTLDFKLREEDRHLMPPASPDEGVESSPIQRALERDFPPIEDGFPDLGDATARNAVSDALLRMESMIGGAKVQPAPVEQDEDDHSALSDEGADDLLSSGGYGGMGSELESDAPSPYALPKMPGSFSTASYVPPVSEAIVMRNDDVEESSQPAASVVSRAPSEDSFDRASDAMREFEVDEVDEPAMETRAEQLPSEEPGQVPPLEDFRPFDIQKPATMAETFDTAGAQIPTYAQAGRTVKSSESFDDFLPSDEPASVTQGPRTGVAATAFSMPSYSQPRSEIDRDEIEDDAALLEEHFATRREEQEPPVTEMTGEIGDTQPEVVVPSAPTPVRPSFFAQYRNAIVAVAFISALLGVKQFMNSSSQEEGAPIDASPAVIAPAPIEREYSRAPIDQSISGLLPKTDTAPKTSSQVVQQPAQVLLPAVVSPAPNAGLQAQLTELTQRMNALESERNKLRDENESLKKKPVAAKPKKTVVAKKSAAAPVVVDEAQPVRKPSTKIQYLGTFRDGDRLVAEVLIDGELARIKRGEALRGNRRVDAVGDLSVTIDGAVYSP